MEQANGDKPVPAPDDMIARLPRAKVSLGSEWTSARLVDDVYLP